MNDSVARRVDQRHDHQPEPERPRQRARRIPHFAGDPGDFPPAAEREERRDERARDGRPSGGAPVGRATNGTKCDHDAGGLVSAPSVNATTSAIFRTDTRGQQPDPELDARDVHDRERDDRGDGHDPRRRHARAARGTPT